jgi:hypothetical protein
MTVTVATLVVSVLVHGCSVIHLYDQGKDSAARNVKTKYSELKLPAVAATEQQNLAALLEEELAVVRDAHGLRLDLALLRLVDDDEPIGAIFTGRSRWLQRRLNELGYKDTAALRAYLNAWDDMNSRAEAVAIRDDLIYAIAGMRAPACGAPDFAKALDAIRKRVTRPDQRAMLEEHINQYTTNCGDYLKKQGEHEKKLGEPGGEVRLAYTNWSTSRTALSDQRAKARELEASLTKASADYEAAVAANQAASTSETQTRLKTTAAALRDALAAAGNAQDVVGVPALSESRVQAIDTVLVAISGANIDASTVAKPDVQRAARVAEGIPALVGEIDVLVKQSRAPAVSPLVIEKQHQLLLRDDAVRRVSFAAQRVALLETKSRALVAESRFLLAQRDGVCNVVQPDKPDQRINCDTLSAKVADNKWTCAYRPSGAAPGAPSVSQACPALAVTWPQGLQSGTPAAKRALWEALAGLGGRLAIARPQQDEADFRLAHLAHLEVAASDEYAIRAWDALIATPVNQLSAYHQTGIKPAELADLIIKAIGLGAIGVGVNR